MNEQLLLNIEDAVSRLGYECVNVAVKSDSGGRLKLQVLIDSIGGINVEDCERVSKAVNALLDKSEDIFPESERYYLEVSSPGIERPLFKLSDYERFAGREAKVRINGLIENRKTFTGILLGVKDNKVLISLEGEEKTIEFEKIRSGNLIFRFESDNAKNIKNNKRNKKTKEQEGL